MAKINRFAFIKQTRFTLKAATRFEVELCMIQDSNSHLLQMISHDACQHLQEKNFRAITTRKEAQ